MAFIIEGQVIGKLTDFIGQRSFSRFLLVVTSDGVSRLGLGLETSFFESRSRKSQVSSRSRELFFLWSLARSSSLKTDLQGNCSKFSRSKWPVAKLSLLLYCCGENNCPLPCLTFVLNSIKTVCAPVTPQRIISATLVTRRPLLRTIFQLFLKAVLLRKPISKRSGRMPTSFSYEKPNKTRSFLLITT